MWISYLAPLSALLITSASPVQDLRSHLQGKNGFTVHFEQVLANQALAKDLKQASGKVEFTRPNSLVWTYETPKARILRFKGEALEIEENGKHEQIHTHDGGSLREIFSFLWGEIPTTQYRLDIKDAKHFRITPKPGSASKRAFKFIDVEVSGGVVVSARVTDPLDGESLLKFSDWKF